MTHPLSSADIITFYQKSATFVILRNTDQDCILMHNFYFFLTLFESLKVAPGKMVTILMMSSKLATLGLLKIKVT